MIAIPVPRTNTRGRDEYSKVSEKTTVKELGKLKPHAYKRSEGYVRKDMPDGVPFA